MSERYNYHINDKDKEFEINSFKKCFIEKRELDKFLEQLISPYIKEQSLKILDAPCGLGHISYFLSEISPASTFHCVDQTPWMIEEAKKLCSTKTNLTFEVGDIYDVSSKYHKSFDICINWRTISWIPHYEQMLKEIFSMTKKHIFLSSLFYDGDIDFEVKVREYKKEVGKEQFNYYFNTYSFPKFKEYLNSLGAKKIVAYDFDISRDLTKPPIDQMGTYTMRLENGKRLQVSGPLILFWKVIRVDL